MSKTRRDYERAVLDLKRQASLRLARGDSVEAVARWAVDERNALKVEFRADLPIYVLSTIEERNISTYGNPVGPTADQQLAKYQSWREVIRAAARPADLQTLVIGIKRPPKDDR